ncbi:3-oxoacyl-[acyl-carrier-protein] reductase [Lentibacillus sp. JNUCC-1]|nr:3-oxoacyl-[acyl-carrier-protein] reductase [Lentibacillus sp. JNUCC-1]
MQATVAEIKAHTDNAHIDYAICDMKRHADIKKLIAKAVQQNGTVDVLINNVGGPPAGPFLEITDEEWYQSFQRNLLSFVRTIREAAPYMIEQQSGHIINLASSSIKQSLDNMVISNTLRPGIHGLTKTLAQELGEDHILINTVGPGKIKTDRILDLTRANAEKQNISPEIMLDNVESEIPMKRFGTPEEFANAILFLASEANSYISGQSLVIDGGLVKAL